MISSAAVYVGLPISSGGAHGLGRLDHRAAWSAWNRFLDQRTLHGAIAAGFRSWELSHFDEDPDLSRGAQRVRDVVRRAFPPSPDEPRLSPVPLERVSEALDLLHSLEPLPVDRWGNTYTWFMATADFRLLDPRDGGVWPGQDVSEFGGNESYPGVPLGVSSTRLHLHGRSSMGLELCVPEATDDDLRWLVPRLDEALPFRMSAKQWRRFTLTKKGTSYVGRRIPASVFA